LLKPQEFKSTLYTHKGDEVPLSGPVLVELLETVLAKGALFRFKAKGFSMSPFIQDGDVITLSSLPDNSPNLGDVVAFINPETKKLTVHRLVGRKGDSFLVKGDNTAKSCDLISIKNIVGQVKKIEREKKRIFIGLGPERVLIAFLTRRRILPLPFPIRRVIPTFIKRLML